MIPVFKFRVYVKDLIYDQIGIEFIHAMSLKHKEIVNKFIEIQKSISKIILSLSN